MTQIWQNISLAVSPCSPWPPDKISSSVTNFYDRYQLRRHISNIVNIWQQSHRIVWQNVKLWKILSPFYHTNNEHHVWHKCVLYQTKAKTTGTFVRLQSDNSGKKWIALYAAFTVQCDESGVLILSQNLDLSKSTEEKEQEMEVFQSNLRQETSKAK